jgi:archaemetzincin
MDPFARDEPLLLVPLDGVPPRELSQLAQDLAGNGFAVSVAAPAELPAQTYDRARGQHRAEPVLDLMRESRGPRVLGVTERDLYAPGMNFVFGIADSPGRAAVMSLFRLGIGADRATKRERALKEAVHELGHTFGLPHCADARCVMHFSNSLADTDAKGSDLCARCRDRLGGDAKAVRLRVRVPT